MIEHKIYKKQNIDYTFSESTMARVKEIIARYPEGKQKSALLPLLHIAQEEFGGSLNADSMDYIANILNIKPIEVYEVATFYTQFYLEPQGKYVIEVCRTGPCVACGAEEMIDYLCDKLNIKDGETTTDGLFSLKTVECLGACGYAPVMQVNTRFHEELDKAKIDQIIDNLRKEANSPINIEEQWVEKFCLKK